ncbi:uncharacterized protein LOC128549382 [Mercenaria mercenaria]|uniref:uncharacterized protein LOC128549382 n=1 Tax=Mercenaria mercenaria TaxID=6596 RepID=UPI00234E7BA3|nr:uncharacterized protein LOC128549382 [Mercenaria mercenaria]
MDDDTSTLTRAKKSLFPDLEKASDRNHVIKNFTSGLYKLRESNKYLTVAIISYFRKCFSYATVQNVGNPVGVRDNILAIVPHVYGDHSKCGDWCKEAEVLNYKHSYKYMGGNDLNNQSLRVVLDRYLERYTTDDMTHKLSNLGSTNGNENMNSMIARKAPKGINYSESESLESRISAAIAQKNKGHQYIIDVNEVHGLSPGKSTRKRFTSLDIRCRKKAERAATVQHKRRRLQLKEERPNVNRVREVEEGTTYTSGVSHIEEADTNEVPSAPDRPKPASEHYSLNDLVVFDLETTGGGDNDSILQILACHLERGTCFTRYAIPTSSYINHHITTLTGLEYHGRTMYKDAQAVDACEIGVALGDFKEWIHNLNTKEPILVAHNASFDGRMLNNAFQRHSVTCSRCVKRYADTLPYFKTKYPGRKGKGAYTLSSLVHEYLPGKQFSFHDADEDVRGLSELLISSHINEEDLKCHLTSVEELTYKSLLKTNKMENIGSYNRAVKNKNISIIVSEKLAESGLGLDHLKTVAGRSGADGVKTLLKSRCGQCRFNVEDIMSEL